jgi:hypothetical protein
METPNSRRVDGTHFVVNAGASAICLHGGAGIAAWRGRRPEQFFTEAGAGHLQLIASHG